jgi:hypothetical protein
MTLRQHSLPDLYACIDPAIAEIVEARNGLVDHVARLELKLQDLRASRSQKQAASLALAAEDIARTAHQIQGLAESIHRGIAKRLKLEARV